MKIITLFLMFAFLFVDGICSANFLKMIIEICASIICILYCEHCIDKEYEKYIEDKKNTV